MATRIERLLGSILREKALTLAVAESCTGGLLGHRITQVPGSSDYFLGGMIAYSNRAKLKLLGVSEKTLEKYGAVSSHTAVEMAAGVRRSFCSDISIAVTGIAGPGGGGGKKPVGLVYIALADMKRSRVRKCVFSGTRHRIKMQAVRESLNMLCDYIATIQSA